MPQELVGAYRDLIVPIASMVTPNQFEAELLTGRPVQTLDDAVRLRSSFACRQHVCLPSFSRPSALCVVAC